MSDPSFGAPPPPRREPAFNLPAVVVWIVALLALVQAGRGFASDQDDFAILAWFGFVPARLSLWLSPDRAEDIASALARVLPSESIANRLQLVTLMLSDTGPRVWTLVTYGLLHGSWVHLLSNVIWLAAFGGPVARRLGGVRFLVLMVASTIGGALMHWWSRELDLLPLVGASAAVSGATAAAARFVFSPGLRFGNLADDDVVRAIPAEGLGSLWRNRRAMVFILFWFVTNFLFGSGLVPIFGEESSIAWEAHIGGFLIGLLLFPLLDRGVSAR